MPAHWENTATLEEVPSLPQSYCCTVGTILKTCIAGGEDKVADVCQKGHICRILPTALISTSNIIKIAHE